MKIRFESPVMFYGIFNSRGQLKIQQMAFMLIAVTLFFALVGLFLIVFVFSGLKGSATALQEKNALLLVTKLANSPEFSCEDVFDGEVSDRCELAKLIVSYKEAE